jgi:hypothetical protein
LTFFKANLKKPEIVEPDNRPVSGWPAAKKIAKHNIFAGYSAGNNGAQAQIIGGTWHRLNGIKTAPPWEKGARENKYSPCEKGTSQAVVTAQGEFWRAVDKRAKIKTSRASAETPARL